MQGMAEIAPARLSKDYHPQLLGLRPPPPEVTNLLPYRQRPLGPRDRLDHEGLCHRRTRVSTARHAPRCLGDSRRSTLRGILSSDFVHNEELLALKACAAFRWIEAIEGVVLRFVLMVLLFCGCYDLLRSELSCLFEKRSNRGLWPHLLHKTTGMK